jgi:hypothetical protein
MNDSSPLAALAKKTQAAKKQVSLATILEDTAVSDVIVGGFIDKVTHKALLDDNGRPISTALSILGVHFSSLKVDQIRMLCVK